MLSLQSTQLTCYSECPRKWYYNYRLRRSKPAKPAMTRGSCFHKIAELYYGDGLSLEDIPAHIQEHNPDYLEHLGLCMVAFGGYLETYPDVKVVTIGDAPAVEIEFEMPLAEDIILRGKFDKIQRLMNRTYVTDYKFTGQYLSDWYFAQFEMTYQTMLYSFVAREFLPDINGFIIDAISVKTSKHKYARQFYPMLPNLDGFIRNVMQDAIYIRDNLNNEDAFPQRYTSCFGRYGKCNYFEVCNSADHRKHAILESDLFEDYKPIYDEMKVETPDGKC